jgi:hypothetical protein
LKFNHRRFEENGTLTREGVDVMVLKMFLPKNKGQKLAVWARITSIFYTNMFVIDHNFGFQ